MTKDKVTANGRRKAVAILMLVAMMFSVFGAALPERAFAADGTITLKVGRVPTTVSFKVAEVLLFHPQFMQKTSCFIPGFLSLK